MNKNINVIHQQYLYKLYECRKEPDLELEGLLKRHYTTVEFFQGTMMNAVDLERVKVHPFKSFFFAYKNQQNSFVVQVYTVSHTRLLWTILNIEHSNAAKIKTRKSNFYMRLLATYTHTKLKTMKKWNFEHYQQSIHRTVNSTHLFNTNSKKYSYIWTLVTHCAHISSTRNLTKNTSTTSC